MKKIDFIKNRIKIFATSNKLIISGTAWTTFSFIYKYFVRLISTIIITRMLEPEAFGLMSLAMIFVTGLVLFSDVGISPAVIQSRNGTKKSFLCTAWTIKVIRGLIICIIGIAMAWPIASLYDEPRLIALICALSIIPLMDGFTSIAQLTCQRNVDLKNINIIEIISTTFSMITTMFIAWYSGSHWSLAIGAIFGSILKMILSYFMLPSFSHKISIDRIYAFEILRFGLWLLLSTISTFFMTSGLILVQGMFVSAEIVGFITLANTLSWAMGEFIGVIISNVFFPAISNIIRSDISKLKSSVYKVLTYMYFGFIPLFLLLSIISVPLIDAIYDDRYKIVGQLLSVMAINSALMTMFSPYSNVILAQGDAKLHFIIIFIAALLRILFLILGFHIYGLFGMIIGTGIGVIIFNIFLVYVTNQRGFGCMKRDYLMLFAWTTIFCVISFFVLAGNSH